MANSPLSLAWPGKIVQFAVLASRLNERKRMTASTNGAKTATVETLTAEVRVLMIGSRQITMSVFKQLDHRPVEEIEAFGRVSIPVKEDGFVGVDVTGCSSTDGTLVRAWVERPAWYSEIPDAFGHWAYHNNGNKRSYYRMAEYGIYHLRWKSTRASVRCPLPSSLDLPAAAWREDRTLCNWLDAEYRHRRYLGELCDLPALRRAWDNDVREELAELTAAQERCDELCALPLIVLAGPR
jgi:hypothetical protein